LICQEAGCVVESLSGDPSPYIVDPIVTNEKLLPMLKDRLAG